MSELEEQGGPVIGSPGLAQDLMAALMRDTVPLPTPGLLFQHSIGAAIIGRELPVRSGAHVGPKLPLR
jgi:hypothetical protein